VLIGRVDELAQLDAMLDAARRGDSGALVIRGEPGVGKSSLLSAVVERAYDFRVLRALGVEWGSVEEGRGSSGTFRETWRLVWEPELTIRVIELAAHGTTVHAAATHRLLERAASAEALADLVAVLDIALLADLPEVVQPVVSRVEAQAAHDPDVVRVIDTLGPLARALRYGDVRGTDAAALRAVFDGLVVRVLAGVVMACRSLDDSAAAAMVERLAGAQAALALIDHPVRRGEWPAVLAVIAERGDVHGLVQGRATRLLHDGGSWNRASVGARLSRALSVGTAPAAGAAFVEGFVAGSGTVLVHDTELLGLIDTWVSSLPADSFIAVVPLLRRTFGAFEPGERRQLGLLIADSNWLFPAIEAVHIVALALLFGAILALNLRLLGLVFTHKPVAQLARELAAWIFCSLIIILSTGFLLFSSEAMRLAMSSACSVTMAITRSSTLRCSLIAACTSS